MVEFALSVEFSLITLSDFLLLGEVSDDYSTSDDDYFLVARYRILVCGLILTAVIHEGWRSM